MKKISILGSTGSIGLNTLEVIKKHPKQFSVVALAARRNADLLFKQACQFKPKLVCIYEDKSALELSKRLKPHKIKVVTGEDGLIQASTEPDADQVVFSVVGAVGLKPLIASIEARKSVAIANKESLVMAGELVMDLAVKKNVVLLPIDSEHSGLWQCLEGKPRESIKKLVITSSGGPFFKRKINFKRVSVSQALNHPKWRMGPKISIDSATFMNKGLEVIEASNLFSVPCEKIEVLVHPEAVVHAMVEFVDGSQIAQLAVTDMKLPIQYALSYPERIPNSLPSLDLTKIGKFHFYRPDIGQFPCLELGYEAKRAGGTMPAVLNGANEIAVERFLNKSMSFDKISKVIEKVMTQHRIQKNPGLSEILQADEWARREAENICLNF